MKACMYACMYVFTQVEISCMYVCKLKFHKHSLNTQIHNNMHIYYTNNIRIVQQFNNSKVSVAHKSYRLQIKSYIQFTLSALLINLFSMVTLE